MKICPKCTAKNLDFKIYCGECGSSLSEGGMASGSELSGLTGLDVERVKIGILESIPIMLRESQIFGITVMLLPIVFTYLSFDLIIDLSLRGLVSTAMIYGAMILLTIESIFIFGCVLFNREYRLGYVEPPVRGVIVFLITFSFAPYVILLMTSVIGHFDTEYSALIVLGFALFLSWVFFFGWLAEAGPRKSRPGKIARK